MKRKIFLTKLTQWEHWPSYMFYGPLIPYYFFRAFKARNLLFFLTTNPAIKYSGSGTESKYKTIQLIPEVHRPKTVFLPKNIDFKTCKNKIAKAEINYPLIAKPDVGFRGFLVKKIDNDHELKSYLKKNDVAIIIQEFVALKNECGIFYSRIPTDKKGRISSITLKSFLTVIGDGTSTLSELILNDDRACLYYDLLKNIHQDYINHIPEKGEEKLLTVIGNHSKGTQFINGNHLIDSDLTKMLDNLNKQIDGWFYGRLDIKYDTFDKLKQGKDFKILEINGIISEPTHIYDATKASYLDALKSIKNHWKIIGQVSGANHKKNNISYPKLLPYIKELFWLRKYSKKIIDLNKVN